MTAEMMFMIVNFGVLAPWLLLLFAPRWRYTQRLVHSAAIPALLGAAYVVVLITVPPPDGSFDGTLPALMRFLGSPWGAVVGLLHFVAFDLFVGAWMSRDAQRRRIPHLAVVPALLLTLMFGPSGLLLYFVVRAAMRRTLTLNEKEPALAAA